MPDRKANSTSRLRRDRTHTDAAAPAVSLLPLEIAGWAARVQEGLAQSDWSADVIDLSGDPYGYGATGPAERSLQWLRAAYVASARLGLVGRVLTRPCLLPLRLFATWTLLRRRDALIYLFGRTLLWGLDLRLARARGIRTIAVYLGGDARPPWMDGDHLVGTDQVRWRMVKWRTYLVARRVRAMERSVDLLVCHPSYCQFLTKPFVNWLAIGMPAGTAPKAGRASTPSADDAIVVVHAPTRRTQKGSDEVEAAVARLIELGCPVHYERLSGLPNSVVLAHLAKADIVVDQLWSDSLFPSLSSEAGIAGATPLVFGNAKPILVPLAEALGIPYKHFGAPDELDERLLRAVTDREWREQVASESAEYLRTRCAPAAVGRRVAQLLRGEVPADWWVDPDDVVYLEGYGMSGQTALDRLREYVDRFGLEALQLHRDGRALVAVRDLLGQDSSAMNNEGVTR